METGEELFLKCCLSYLFCHFFQTKASPLLTTPLITEECSARDRCPRLQMNCVPGPCRVMAFPQPRSGRSEHLKCWSLHLQSGSGPAGSGRPHSPCWTFGTEADLSFRNWAEPASCLSAPGLDLRVFWWARGPSWSPDKWQTRAAPELLWKKGRTGSSFHIALCYSAQR